MAKKTFELTANVSTENPQAIRRVLEGLFENGFVTPTDDGFQVKAKMVGESARDLNRTVLSALRKVEKKTRLRSEWAFGKNEGNYDLIFDSGCPHSFDDRKRIKYKEKVLSLMSQRSIYVLIHADKVNVFDFGLGPRPKTKKNRLRIF